MMGKGFKTKLIRKLKVKSKLIFIILIVYFNNTLKI